MGSVYIYVDLTKTAGPISVCGKFLLCLSTNVLFLISYGYLRTHTSCQSMICVHISLVGYTRNTDSENTQSPYFTLFNRSAIQMCRYSIHIPFNGSLDVPIVFCNAGANIFEAISVVAVYQMVFELTVRQEWILDSVK